MHVAVDREAIEASAGDSETLVLTVSNTSEVIDEYTVNALGIDDGRYVRVDPPDGLVLFPGESGQLEVTLTIPSDRPARGTSITSDGRNRVGLKVSSELSDLEVVEVELHVQPISAIKVEVTPNLVTMGRRGDFSIKVTNTGNDDPTLFFHAIAAEDHLDLRVWPTQLAPRVGQTEYAFMTAQGRRKLFGSPVVHEVTLTTADERTPDEPLETIVTILQRAWIPLAALLVGGLFLLFGVMAVVLSSGIDDVSDAVDKRVDNVELDLLDAQEKAADDLRAATGDPDAGSAEGVIRASSDDSPVAGAIIAAVPTSPIDESGDRVPVVGEKWTDATSDETGAFDLEGLPAGMYELTVTADGYLPFTTSELSVLKRTPKDVEPIVLVGQAGKISGSVLELVNDGSTLDSSGTTVRLDLVDKGSEGDPLQVATTDADGVFSLTGVETPGVYELQFDKGPSGSRSRTVRRVTLSPGEEVVLDPVEIGDRMVTLRGYTLSQPSSNCASDNQPAAIGGITIEAISNSADQTLFRTRSLTAGPGVDPADVGSYQLTSLPTPATYSVSASAPGYRTRTTTVTLDGDISVVDFCPDLFLSTGEITGKITDSETGADLGGATINVTGSDAEGTAQAFSATTISLTADGSYRIAGLPTPGTYNLAFALDGYERIETEVSLIPEDPRAVRSIALNPESVTGFGTITGNFTDVLGAGVPGAGLKVEVGGTSRIATTVTEEDGEFRITGLLIGSEYEISVVNAPFTIQLEGSESNKTFTVTADGKVRGPDGKTTERLTLVGISTDKATVTATGFVLLRVTRLDGVVIEGSVSASPGGNATVENIAFGNLVIFEGNDADGNLLRRPVVLEADMTFNSEVRQ